MPRVQFTSHLRRFFPDLGQDEEIEATSVAELVVALNDRYPGFADYVVDERGALRQHVNIFVGENLVRDRTRLSDPLDSRSEVFILQALSGG
jgi:molybdopterin converting factor small subunit